MRWRWWCVVLALTLVAGACAGGGGASSDEGAAASGSSGATESAGGGETTDAASTSGTCEVAVTGDVEFSSNEPLTVPSNSDYWLNDKELATAKDVHDDFDARVAAGQQILQIFQTGCGTTEGVLLATTDETTRSDVPKAPGTYNVLNYLDKAKPGIAAAVALPGDVIFGVTGGTVTITRFDDSGVAGTFDLTGEEIPSFIEPGTEPKEVTIKGEFDVPCWSGASGCES